MPRKDAASDGDLNNGSRMIAENDFGKWFRNYKRPVLDSDNNEKTCLAQSDEAGTRRTSI